MTVRVVLEPVFVLHHRPYRTSSLIVELLSKQHGRVAAVARSARGPKSRYKGCLQIFSPLLVSWSGRRDLMNLNQVELSGSPFQLTGEKLLCAFYLNELLLRLLPPGDPYPNIFLAYQTALQNMEHSAAISAILRCFEKRLLENLGYGLTLDREAQNGRPIDEDRFYRWLPECGFVPCAENNVSQYIFLGRSLLALQAEQWDNTEDLRAMKHLMRLVLSQHLGNKPLKSRELLQQAKKVD